MPSFFDIFRSCVSSPNRLAWYRRFSGLSLRGQQCHLRSLSFSEESVALALSSFRTFQVFLRWILEAASPCFLPFSLFCPQPPKMLRTGAPKDSFQRLDVSLLSMGVNLLGVLDRLSSATLLGGDPVVAYFFSSECLEPLRVPSSSSSRPTPLLLTENGGPFRSH
jgi:hypothetical protein